MFWLDTPMMCSFDPGLQVAKDEVDHWQVRLCLVWITTEHQRHMAVSHLGQSWVAGPSVGIDDSAKRDVLFDKACQHFGAPIRRRREAAADLRRCGGACVPYRHILTRPHLDGADYGRLVVRAPSFSACLATDIAFIDFDQMPAADGIAFGANHASAELVSIWKAVS